MLNENVNATIISGTSNSVDNRSGAYVTYVVIDNTLIIGGSGNIYITASKIDSIILNGNSTLSNSSILNMPHLVIKSNSTNSSEVNDITIADSLIAIINNSGTFTLSGTTNMLKVENHNAGKFSGYGLTSIDCNVEVTGTGSIYVYVTDSLSGFINGNGNVYYKGNPASTHTENIGGTGQFIKQ